MRSTPLASISPQNTSWSGAPQNLTAVVMRDQQPAIDEMDIGFDAAEAVVQRVQQRACVLIVIMGMGMNQRHGLGSKA